MGVGGGGGWGGGMWGGGAQNFSEILICVIGRFIYTTIQKFPFKIAKQASTMNPDIISKSCTYTNSVTMPVY